MSFSENAFNEQKSKLRIEAMEKEVQRLKTSSQKQSSKIGTLRRSLYLQLVFFVSLFSILLFKGLIQFPHSSGSIENRPLQAETTVVKDSTKKITPNAVDSVNQIIYNTHKGALPKDDYDGILFAIQIGAYTGIDLEAYEGKLLGIKQDTYEGINQFTLGEFIEYDEANSFLDLVQQMGFQDAFIMSFKNGRRIQIQDALAMRKKERPTEEEVKTAFEEKSPLNQHSLVSNTEISNENVAATMSNDGIQL